MFSTEQIPHLCEIISRLYGEFSTENGGSQCFTYDTYSLQIVNDFYFLQNMLDMKNETFILVSASKASNMACRDTSVLPEGQSNGEPEDPLNITGCPLECPFGPNDSIFDVTITCDKIIRANHIYNKYIPLSESQASEVINVFRKILKHAQDINDNVCFMAPFAVICDGLDAEGTIAMGLHKIQNYLKWFKIKCKDVMYHPSRLPSFDRLKKDHLWGLSHNMIETEAKAVYEILDNTIQESDSKAKSRIILECFWKNVSYLLETPNDAATCSVHFDVIFGDVRSITYPKWKELKILEELVQAITSKAVTWTSSNANPSLFSDIDSLLESVKIDNRKRVSNESKKDSEANLLHKLIVKGRENLDFTDKLWVVLRGCESREELRKYLQYILQIVQGGEIKPVVFNRNTTSLGKILTDVHRRKTDIADFEIINPLHLLAEIGMEKLKQDYVAVFLSSGLVTKDNLNPLINRISIADWNESFSSLLRLHCVTELIILCQTYIDPPETLLSKIARMALARMTSATFESDCQSFSFQIDRQAVLKNPDRAFLSEWKVSLKSNQDSYAVHTNIQLSTEHPLTSPGRRRSFSAGFLNKEIQYHLCISNTVQDNILMA